MIAFPPTTDSLFSLSVVPALPRSFLKIFESSLSHTQLVNLKQNSTRFSLLEWVTSFFTILSDQLNVTGFEFFLPFTVIFTLFFFAFNLIIIMNALASWKEKKIRGKWNNKYLGEIIQLLMEVNCTSEMLWQKGA